MQYVSLCISYRKLESIKSVDNKSLKCAIDHIIEAQEKGEINEDNVLYIVENINVAGMFPSFNIALLSFSSLLVCPKELVDRSRG